MGDARQNVPDAANLAQDVEQLAISNQPKNALVKAQHYSGLPTDPSKQQMLISWG